MRRKQKLTSLIPAIWASFFDITITIVHQSKEYWNGDLTQGNEGNPIGDFMMKNHVYGIFLISIFWLILIAFLGYKLPRKYSRIFLLFVLIAYSYGASSWLTMKYGFWFSIIFILLNSILFYKIDDITSKKKT